jgi:predicted glutamine amidotransferase
MCRLYGLRATEPTKVECTLVYAQNALMSQSRQDLAGHSHGHGWGVAIYEDHMPRIEKQAWAAFHGEHFRQAAARIHARAVLAHIRRATVGPAAPENTHPFVHDRWAFAHNGTIPHFDTVRARMLEATAAPHRASIGGSTDSEHLFHMLLTAIEAAPTQPLTEVVRQTLKRIIDWCHSVDPTSPIGLNVLLTDGDQFVGSRWGRTLFYVERDGVHDCEICGFPHIRHHRDHNYRATVVASEPISHEAWQEVPEGSIFRIAPDMSLQLEPLLLPAPTLNEVN